MFVLLRGAGGHGGRAQRVRRRRAARARRRGWRRPAGPLLRPLRGGLDLAEPGRWQLRPRDPGGQRRQTTTRPARRCASPTSKGRAPAKWSSRAGPRPGSFFLALDLDSGVRPNLLAEVDNGLGGKRTFRYQATGDLMAQAQQAGAPWQSVIPFPLQVATDLHGLRWPVGCPRS